MTQPSDEKSVILATTCSKKASYLYQLCWIAESILLLERLYRSPEKTLSLSYLIMTVIMLGHCEKIVARIL